MAFSRLSGSTPLSPNVSFIHLINYTFLTTLRSDEHIIPSVPLDYFNSTAGTATIAVAKYKVEPSLHQPWYVCLARIRVCRLNLYFGVPVIRWSWWSGYYVSHMCRKASDRNEARAAP
jgi:hypothetical protein